MKIVAFDFATVAGVAVGMSQGKPTASTLYFGPGTSHGNRFFQCMVGVDKLLREHRPDVIAIEAAIAGGVIGSKSRVQLAMGWRAICLTVAHKRSIKVHEYGVPEIRNHFVGANGLKKNQGKTLTLDRCRNLNWNVENHNEADACAVWAYARAKLAGIATPPPFGLFD